MKRISFVIFLSAILFQQQLNASNCKGAFVPDVFDLNTMTDSTRFAPVFDSGLPEKYNFDIYNQYGQILFHTDIPEKGWNGTLNNRGTILPDGMYMWILSFTLYEDSVSQSCTGFVSCTNMNASVKITGLDTLQCRPSTYVPQAFTPNGDGTNDEFRPVFGCPPLDYELMIFDRWGNLVFNTKDHNAGWTATTLSGELVQMDVYVWKIKYRAYPGDKLRQHIGHVTVIR